MPSTSPKTRKVSRHHSADFKRDIVSLVQSGKPVSRICSEHDLAPSVVYAWLNKADAAMPRDRAAAMENPERLELIRLRRENAQLVRERDFLKKTAAYFAKARP